MLARVSTAALSGIDALLIKVEADVQMRGLPSFSMVGLLETAVKEARDRVSAAIRNAGYKLPGRKTVVSLSPADVRKSGAHYDLPIAIGILAAVGICPPAAASRYLIAGELSLTGKLLPIGGALLMALAARDHCLDGIILPAPNGNEAALSGDIRVVPVETLAQAVEFLATGKAACSPRRRPPVAAAPFSFDYSEVRGQAFAKRGMEIAAAGGHHVALTGPPGTGKTMLAERLPTILPTLTPDESIETAKIMSWHGLLRETPDIPAARPFRAPHHGASSVGIIGGGSGGTVRLGELSLAHNGVLFLDELGEFRRDVIEALRQPLESGVVRVVRAGLSIAYPARFQIVAAFNPCPCGYLTHPARPCSCSLMQIRKYRSKLSGPLLDRIDLHIEVGPPPHEALLAGDPEEGSAAIRARVLAARKRQEARYSREGRCNAQLSGKAIAAHCPLAREERVFLRSAAEKSLLSARALHRVLKVARTIADLAGAEAIAAEHLAEAMQFRPGLEDGG